MIVGMLLLGLSFSAVMTAIVYLPIILINRHKTKTPALRHLAVIAFLLCFFTISFATVIISLLINGFAAFQLPRYLNLQPFIWLTRTNQKGSADMISQPIYNVLMFIPFGALLPVVYKNARVFWKGSIIILGFSLVIEALQYFIGRSADIDDIIMNLLGGVIGLGLYMLLGCLFKNRLWWKRLNGL